MKRDKFAILVAAVLGTVVCVGADAPDELKEFLRSGKAARIMCEQGFKISYDRGTECSEDHKQRVSKAYAAASKALSKNKKASAALKDYYVSWLGYFKGLEPGLSERQINYQQRQSTNEDKLNLLEAKIEIEMQ